eukprot:scaffold1606_cov46-Phaeocystis_antarctica.AAC.1
MAPKAAAADDKDPAATAAAALTVAIENLQSDDPAVHPSTQKLQAVIEESAARRISAPGIPGEDAPRSHPVTMGAPHSPASPDDSSHRVPRSLEHPA